MKYCLPLLLLFSLPAQAQNTAADVFMDGKDGAKVQVASGFICPQRIGPFERDAVGESDPETGASFCAYSAEGGIYGIVTLTKLTGQYDPKLSLLPDFTEQEGIGSKRIAEANLNLGAQSPLSVYTRTYQTSTLEDLSYRILFTGAVVSGWAVETSIEYADPRDTPVEKDFLHAIYAAATAQITAK